jgi:predicted transport protein
MASPEEMEAKMVANLKEKTGKTLPQWLKITSECGFKKHGQIVKFLKTEFEIGHGFANLIAHKTLAAGSRQPSAEDLVASQYSGNKVDLRPIYDALIAAVTKLGADVEISPKKTYVSLRRRKQFALIQPSTGTRVDVGLNLGDHETTDRLEASGSFNSMCSHRVRLTTKKDVNAELRRWLKLAYEEAS